MRVSQLHQFLNGSWVNMSNHTLVHRLKLMISEIFQTLPQTNPQTKDQQHGDGARENYNLPLPHNAQPPEPLRKNLLQTSYQTLCCSLTHITSPSYPPPPSPHPFPLPMHLTPLTHGIYKGRGGGRSTNSKRFMLDGFSFRRSPSPACSHLPGS